MSQLFKPRLYIITLARRRRSSVFVMLLMKIMSMWWLLLLLFIAFQSSVCLSDEIKACEDASYNCGELVGIKYPFWGNERQSYCGNPAYKLSCNNNNITTIQIDSVTHNVLEINQTDSSMRIAIADMFDNICPKTRLKSDIHYYPFSMDDILKFSNGYMSLWYSCLRNVSLHMYTFPCGWEDENQGTANYFSVYDELELEGCQMNVNVTISVPVFYENNTKAMLEEVVRQGFNVVYDEWSNIACTGCKESGGNCVADDTHQFYCSCANGDAHPYLCLPPTLKTHLISSFHHKLIKAAVPTGSIILAVSIIIFIYCTWKRISNKDEIEGIVKRYSTLTPKRYTYSKLKKITDSFRHKLGQGGFSTVYKGTLPDGCEVAVKLLKESKEDGEAFMNEVVSITRTSHVNIVTILGFCYESNNRALVYEYMPKGSLEKYMFNGELQQNNDVKLDWNMLYSIVMGVARGLEYLHRGCSTRIVHFDIKPHNILLDNEFCPKISDFGLAKQCVRESFVSMTGVKGTIGFMAPEMMFRNLGKVSHKSDVYSYGMLVLEMVGERKNPNQGVEVSSEEYFPDWIYKDLVQNTDGVGGCRWGNTEVEEEEEMVRKMIIVGLCCIQTLPEERPAMSEVVAMLEGSVNDLQIPPKPTLFGPPELPQPSSSSISLTSIHSQAQQNEKTKMWSL